MAVKAESVALEAASDVERRLSVHGMLMMGEHGQSDTEIIVSLALFFFKFWLTTIHSGAIFVNHG